MLKNNSVIFFGIFIFFLFASGIYFAEVNLNILLWCFFWISLFLITSKVEKIVLSPVWIVFFYFITYFFIRPGFYLLNEAQPFTFNIYQFEIDPILSTFLFVSSAYLPFVFGYTVYSGFKDQKNKLSGESYSESFLMLIVIMLEIAIIVSSLILIINFGGLGNIISIQSALVKAIPESGFISKLAFIFILLSFLPPALLLARDGFKLRVFLLATFNILLCLIFGRRLAIISIFVPFAVYYYFYKKRFSTFTGLIMYIFALLLLTSIVAFRISNSAEAGKSLIEETAEFFIWDMVITLMNSYGNDESFRYGLDFIPKQLLLFWGLDGGLSEYPSIGESLVSRYFPIFAAGIPMGIFGLFYMQGGFVALIFLSFFFGILCKYMFKYFLERVDRKLFFLTIFPFFIITFFHFVRVGDFWRITISQGRIFLAIYLVYYIINRFRFNKSYG